MISRRLIAWAKNLAQRKAPPLPLAFPTSAFELVPKSNVLEEEQFDEFKSGRYFPVRIGDVYASKYQVVGKLGFGTTSTVWLARSLQAEQYIGKNEYVALKVFIKDAGDKEEFRTYHHVSKAKPCHPGYRHVRRALDMFILNGPRGEHHCLVQEPMWDSWKDLLLRNPAHRFSEELLKAGLRHLLLGLDYLHTECKIVHTDIKADNILQEIADEEILDAFTRAELESPTPRKFIDGTPVYLSRRFKLPEKFGGVVLSDFGSAVRGDQKRNHDAQPNVYRCPEVMLKTEWSYPVDIWNVGVMIWDLFERKHLFYGDDPDGKGYSTRAHLAEVIGMLGPPPLDLLRRGIRSKEFFTPEGEFKAEVPIPTNTSLENSEEYLEGKSKRGFLTFVRGMLQWRPEDRKTAKQLLEDPWLNSA